MSEILQFTLGEIRRITRRVVSNSAFSIASATAYVYDEDGDPAAGASAVASNNNFGDSAASWDLYFAFTPGAEGDYTYQIEYVVGTQHLRIPEIPGFVSVWPPTTFLNRYLERIVGWGQFAQAGSAFEQLTRKDLKQALDTAITEYSKKRPRRVVKALTLTANDWTYDLASLLVGSDPAAEWLPGFSDIYSIEYPLDDTIQRRNLLSATDYEIDEDNNILRFNYVSPSAGQSARVVYSTKHTISHDVDTTPSSDFDSITQYAAGVCLSSFLANRAANTNEGSQQVDTVSYKDIQTRRRQQGTDMKKEAMSRWRSERELSL